MDFETIETFCKFGKWLALTPHSCQNKNPSCLHRCHNFLVFAIYIAGVINVHHALVPIYLSLTHIQLILAILINANYYLFSSYILVVVMGQTTNCSKCYPGHVFISIDLSHLRDQILLRILLPCSLSAVKLLQMGAVSLLAVRMRSTKHVADKVSTLDKHAASKT
ncbi:unnamed protein product [Tenebrio molitor]|nr:unnamed protein product [Tenebrio molitor]